MFSNLIESGSHAADLKRRGTFFVGALAFYALLLAAAGVGSVYAYHAHLDAESDYEVHILRFRPSEETPRAAVRREAPRPAAAARAPQFATRPEASVNTPYGDGSFASAATKEVSARTPVMIGPLSTDPPPGGFPVGHEGAGASRPGGVGSPDGPRVHVADTPPPVPQRATPTPAPRPEGPVRLTTTLITSKAVHKPVPIYPTIARHAGIQGQVAVQILVDEQGRVASARATSGNPLLQHAAAQAALQARFTPTVLNGHPVKVTGVITYNFTIQ